MFALALHVAIGIRIYRKYVMFKDTYFWYPFYTGFLILQHHFYVVFYWVGDWDNELFFLPRFWYIYIFLFLLYFILFLIYFTMYYFAYFQIGFMEETTNSFLNCLQDIFKKFFLKILDNFEKDFLKKQWYLKQLNKNKWKKLKFEIFIKLTSTILVIIHLSILSIIFFLCYYLVHKWTSDIFITFERNFFYILIKILKFWFIYNFYISLFFSSTSFSWILLIVYVGDTWEKIEYPLLTLYDIEEIVDVYTGAGELVIIFDAVTCTIRDFYAGRTHQVYYKNPIKKLVLFNKRKYEPEVKHLTPEQWFDWKDKCLSCYVPHNNYYKFQLNWTRVHHRFYGIRYLLFSRYYLIRDIWKKRKSKPWTKKFPYIDTFCISEYPTYQTQLKNKKLKKYKYK